MTEKTIDFGQMTTENTIKSLQSSLTRGLSSDEVATRVGQYGYNEIPEKKADPLKAFVSKFWGLTAWMLEIIISSFMVPSQILRLVHRDRASCLQFDIGF